MLQSANKYRSIANENKRHMLTHADVAELKIIENRIYGAATFGAYEYTHDCDFNEAVKSYILSQGFALVTTKGKFNGKCRTINWE